MRARLLIVLVLLVAVAAGQEQSGSAQTGSTAKTVSTAPPPSGQKKAGADAVMDEAFSSSVADAVLARMAQGLARRNPKRVLSVFEPAKYPDYAAFAERISAVLSQYDSFRTYFHVLEASEQDGHGAAQVDLTTERKSVNSGSVPDRRQARARFEFERGTKGWRIVAMTPPDLLTQ